MNKILIALAILASARTAQAAIAVDSVGFSYAQSFDSLPPSASATP